MLPHSAAGLAAHGARCHGEQQPARRSSARMRGRNREGTGEKSVAESFGPQVSKEKVGSADGSHRIAT